MEEELPPDIILVSDFEMLSDLVNEGLLLPLESYFQKSNFDFESLVPAKKDGIRQAGDGISVYALAPMFMNSALFYNKSIFNQRGVQYPTDGMTWDQIAELSHQVQSGEGEEKIYGLTTLLGGTLNDFVMNFAAPLGLRVVDDDGKTVIINTPDWLATLNKYVGYTQEGLFANGSLKRTNNGYAITEDQYRFMQGKAAMAIMASYEIDKIMNPTKYRISNAQQFEWDVVTLPTHPEAPGVGGYLSPQGLMAINKKSQNAKAAWEFISYLNSDEVMKVKSKNPTSIVSRQEYIQSGDHGALNMAAFYSLKPTINPFLSLKGYHWEFYRTFRELDSDMQEVIENKKTPEEALRNIQDRLQAALNAGK